jgi:hypothetical protein
MVFLVEDEGWLDRTSRVQLKRWARDANMGFKNEVQERGARLRHLSRPRWRGNITDPMKRVLQAPNLALATLWVDMLEDAGIAACVQRAYSGGIAGEIPPDQALPEVWVKDDSKQAFAATWLQDLQRQPHRHWACQACQEIVDGPFEQCWNCGALMPS